MLSERAAQKEYLEANPDSRIELQIQLLISKSIKSQMYRLNTAN